MSPIYISPMCNVESDSLLCGNNKIRNSLFLSSHGIRAKRENLIFGRSCFIPISVSATGAPSHRRSSRSRRRHCRRRLFGQLFSGRKPHSSKRTRPIYPPVATPPSTGIPRAVTRVLSPATRRPRAGACVRVWARVFFSGDGTPHTGSSGAVLVFYPSDGPTRALLIHLLAIFAPP